MKQFKQLKQQVCLLCYGDKPVHVRSYYRVRFGKLEYVREHCRRLPRR